MDNSDATEGHAMTPQEFAKLMGAYPQPAENPLPTYGGYMDNSPANFSFVEFNDYFGAEDTNKDVVYIKQMKEEFYDKKNAYEMFEDRTNNYGYFSSKLSAVKDAEKQKAFYESKGYYVELFQGNGGAIYVKTTLNKDISIDTRVVISYSPIAQLGAETFSAEDETEALERALYATMEALGECEADGGIDEREIEGLLAAHPIMEKFNADTFEAPYAGAGSLFGIKQDTGLEGFTTSELTTSSAIHGDFDEASLNYSGHQNFEVRAETMDGRS